MIKNTKLFFYGIIAVIVSIVIIYLSLSSPKESIDVGKGQISKVETMAQLCAIDIYSEVPVLDTVNNKVMFAVQKQKGSVSFDLENIEINTKGDTVKITLSPEIVDIYEATEDNSWEVIDTKAIGPMSLLRSDKFTDEEEDSIKAKIKNNSKKLLYHNGTIERARKEGANSLQMLLEKVYHKPVKVIDPTPKGAHYEEFK